MLLKPGRLDDAEFEHIKMHPRIGSRMLAHQESLSRIHELVRHHHERLDGNGYPDKLAGESIPLGARILAVADTFRTRRTPGIAPTPDLCYQDLKSIRRRSGRSNVT